MVDVRVAIEHGSNGVLVSLKDLVEVVGAVAESICLAERHVAHDVDALVGLFCGIELADEPGDLAVGVLVVVGLVHPKVVAVVEVCVERDDAEVTVGELCRVGTSLFDTRG